VPAVTHPDSWKFGEDIDNAYRELGYQDLLHWWGRNGDEKLAREKHLQDQLISSAVSQKKYNSTTVM
jgi:hypothetical protein